MFDITHQHLERILGFVELCKGENHGSFENEVDMGKFFPGQGERDHLLLHFDIVGNGLEIDPILIDVLGLRVHYVQITSDEVCRQWNTLTFKRLKILEYFNIFLLTCFALEIANFDQLLHARL